MAFPKIEEAVDNLLTLWADRIDDHQTRYGLTAAQVTQIKDDAPWYHYLRLCAAALEEDTTEFYNYKKKAMEGDPKDTLDAFPTFSMPTAPTLENAPKPGIEKRNEELYNFFKKHPNRTEESLADLGITDTPAEPVSPELLAPEIEGKPLIDDRVQLESNRQGQKAIRYEMRRHGGDFTKVVDSAEMDYVDETPSVDGKPEEREYRAVYLKNNKPYGQYSAIITVYTTP